MKMDTGIHFRCIPISSLYLNILKIQVFFLLYYTFFLIFHKFSNTFTFFVQVCT